MTLRGIFSLAFEFFLLIMALGTDIREFLIVAVCMGGLILYSFLSLLLSVISLDCKSKVDYSEFYCGERVKYTLIIRGPVILPVIGKLMAKPADNGDITDKKTLKRSFLLVPAFKLTREYNFDYLCAHTGFWDVGVEKLRVSDMFGLFTLPLLRTKKKNFTTRIAVLPKIHVFNRNGEHVNVSKGFGGTAIRNAEIGELLSDSRNYREGDAMRRINWKQSIRTGKLFTRQYEMPEVPNVLIAIDTACHTDNTGSIVDIYSEITVSLTKIYVEEDITVNVITLRNDGIGSGMDAYFRDERELSELQYRLMETPFKKDRTPLDLFRLDDINFLNADKIYIITANPSEGLFSAMEDLIKQGKTVDCIVPQLTEEPLPSVATAMKNTGIVPVIIKSVHEIAEKVGEVL